MRLEGFDKGRPCRASIIVDTGEPRVWSPLQGYAPWALERVAPLGLRDCGHGRTQGLVALAGLRTLGFGKGRPAGACPATRQLVKERNYRGITSPRTTRDKKAALRVAPLGLWYCGRGRTPTAAQAPIGAIPPQSPGCVALKGRPNPGNPNRPPTAVQAPTVAQISTAAQAPAGRSFSEPRVCSPARATKPWVSQPYRQRSPTGATLSKAQGAQPCKGDQTLG